MSKGQLLTDDRHDSLSEQNRPHKKMDLFTVSGTCASKRMSIE